MVLAGVPVSTDDSGSLDLGYERPEQAVAERGERTFHTDLQKGNWSDVERGTSGPAVAGTVLPDGHDCKMVCQMNW
jgi:hypothetical protein